MSDKHFVIADNRCFDQKLTALELVVYFRICMRAHKSTCFEFINNIAVYCGISDRSVTRSLKKLSALNMINIDYKKGNGKANYINLVNYDNWIKNSVLDNEKFTPQSPGGDTQSPGGDTQSPLMVTHSHHSSLKKDGIIHDKYEQVEKENVANSTQINRTNTNSTLVVADPGALKDHVSTITKTSSEDQMLLQEANNINNNDIDNDIDILEHEFRPVFNDNVIPININNSSNKTEFNGPSKQEILKQYPDIIHLDHQDLNKNWHYEIAQNWIEWRKSIGKLNHNHNPIYVYASDILEVSALLEKNIDKYTIFTNILQHIKQSEFFGFSCEKGGCDAAGLPSDLNKLMKGEKKIYVILREINAKIKKQSNPNSREYWDKIDQQLADYSERKYGNRNIEEVNPAFKQYDDYVRLKNANKSFNEE